MPEATKSIQDGGLHRVPGAHDHHVGRLFERCQAVSRYSVGLKGLHDLDAIPETANSFPYSPCHHFILGICEIALSSIITSSSC
jgi:hypothetical protein